MGHSLVLRRSTPVWLWVPVQPLALALLVLILLALALFALLAPALALALFRHGGGRRRDPGCAIVDRKNGHGMKRASRAQAEKSV